MATALQDILISDRGFAFDPTNGETFQLNTTCLRMVRLLQNGVSEAGLVIHLMEEFEVDEHTASRDVETSLRTLEALNWKP